MSTSSLKHFKTAAVAFALTAVAVTGCRKKAVDTADAAADAAVTVVVDAAAAPEATNEADIARFPDETKIDHVVAPTEANVTNVRKVPVTGAIFTTLAKNSNVIEIAQKGTSFLVVFDDPKNPQQKLMGWISKDAFVATPANKKPTITNPCPKPQQLLLAEQDFCGIVCKVDKDCPSGQTCQGKASLFGLDGKVGETVSTCSFRASIGDAGAATVTTDAGSVAIADAGAADAAKPGLAVINPSGVLGQVASNVFFMAPDLKGNCINGFAMSDDKLCHKTCQANKDCPTGSNCSTKHAKTALCVKTGT